MVRFWAACLPGLDDDISSEEVMLDTDAELAGGECVNLIRTM